MCFRGTTSIQLDFTPTALIQDAMILFCDNGHPRAGLVSQMGFLQQLSWRLQSGFTLELLSAGAAFSVRRSKPTPPRLLVAIILNWQVISKLIAYFSMETTCESQRCQSPNFSSMIFLPSPGFSSPSSSRSASTIMRTNS